MKRILTMAFALVILAGCCNQNSEKLSPVLSIEGGQVQGVSVDRVKDVFVFRGIPYAAAPIRENRWKEPQPVTPWDGVLLADRFEHPSYQHIQFKGGYYTEWGYGDEAPFSEDCLYANVWTKKPGQADAKLPVALWIHGGGYREGWGSEPEFDAQEWAGKDVVLVSINYRLGIFGFLQHPELAAESEHGVSGNYGILDMIQALKWINRNVAQFGGDPDNVMIFGQSAGAMAIKTLCESPLARGLFHKAVIMSGGGYNPNPYGSFGSFGSADMMANATKAAMDWAGYDSLEKMRKADTELIYSVGSLYANANGGMGGMYMPNVDGYVSLESFDAAASDGTLADVPYMIGYCMNDMAMMTSGMDTFCINREEMTKNGSKAWAYEFARPLPDDGSHPEVTATLSGAFHSSDLWYVFKSLQHGWRPWTKGDWDLSEKMLTAWTNFAKYSDPNGPDGGAWAPCTKENPKLMIFKLDADGNEASELGDPVKELGY